MICAGKCAIPPGGIRDCNNVAALPQTGDHADLLVDILFHPGGSLNKCDARQGALGCAIWNGVKFQMKIVRLVVDNFAWISFLGHGIPLSAASV